MDKEAFDSLVSAIEDGGFEAREYSGRGMVGKTCLGVVCDDPYDMIFNIISGACENASDVSEIKDLLEVLENPSRDNMGRSTICYWKNIPWLETLSVGS